ncbi:MAG: DUF2877 domain-containing protein [Propioniciclava sp.]
MTSTTHRWPVRVARRHIGAPPLTTTRARYRGSRVWVLETGAGELCHLTCDQDGLTPGGITVASAELALLDLDRLVEAAPATVSCQVGVAPVDPARLTLVGDTLRAAPRRDAYLNDAAALAGAVARDPRRASALIGRGCGQTPAGDDLVLGALLGLTLTGDPRRAELTDVVTGRLAATTATSRHLLGWGVRGEFPEVLLAVAHALTGGEAPRRAVTALLNWGSTSGWHVGTGLVAAVDSAASTQRSAA